MTLITANDCSIVPELDTSEQPRGLHIPSAVGKYITDTDRCFRRPPRGSNFFADL